jgi:chromosome segregation ATPase
MGSDHFEAQLGDLSGQLKALVPTLDRVEERLHQAQMEAAAAEARNQNLRKDFDDLKTKISTRLADIYKRIQDGLLDGTNHKNEVANLKRDIKEAVDSAMAPLEKRVKDVETYTAELKKKSESRWAKVWDVAKIVLAAGGGALITKLLH